MSYEITIKRKEERKIFEDGPWTVIERRPWTEAEIKSASMEAYGKTAERLIKDDGILKEIRGYAPQRETTKIFDVEVLKQTVDELDLAAVIKAINGL